MKTDCEILLEQAKAEMESIRLAEDREKAELNENIRGGDSISRTVR